MLAPRRRVTLLAAGLATTTLLATSGLVTGSAHAVASRTLFHPYVSTDPTANGADAANVAIGDVSGDGRSDIVMTTGYGSDPASAFSLWVYRQQGGGGLDAPAQIRTGAGYGSVMSVALADLDGDSDLDAAVTTSGGVLLYEQTAVGLVYTSTIPVTGGRDLAAGDLDGDGLTDLAVNTSDGVVLVRQTPAGPDPFAVAQLSSLKVVEVEVGDVTGDGRADVVTGEYESVKVYPQTADGFAFPVTYASGGPDPTWARVNGIAVGDTNGDGRLDVHASVGGNKPSAWVVTRLQQADGTLGTAQVRTTYDEPGAISVADVTGDGFQDLVVAHDGWNEVGVYDSTPGTAPIETLYGVPYASDYQSKGLAVGDISDDGRADVALADYNNGLVLLRGAQPGADITQPQTTITSSPPSTLRSRTATVTFASDEDGTFECALDSGGWKPCTSPWTSSGLSGGSHQVAVRAIDRAGNVDASPASASFTVDGPDTSITSGPTGPIRAPSATFSFTSQPTAASFECALDGYDWSPCSSPTTITDLAPGSAHLFYVRGISADGLADVSPAHRVVDVDPQADLAVAMTAGQTTVKKGGTLTWTTAVRNLGSSASTGTRLTQGLPAGTTFGSASVGSSTSLCSFTSGVVQCAVPGLAGGSSATVTVRTTVTAAKGTLSSTASVTSTSWDPVTTNNGASTTVSINNGK